MNRETPTHRMMAQSRIAAIVVTLAAALATTPATAERITIRPQATPQGTVVRLGDVAEVGAADSDRAEALAALPLMPAPVPGTRKYLRMREVQDLLAAHGEDLGRLQFNGQTVVEVLAPDMSTQEPTAKAVQPAPAAEAKPERISTTEVSKLHDQVRDMIVRYLRAASRRNDPWQVTFELPEQHLQLLRSAMKPPLCEGGAAPWTGSQRLVLYFATAEGTVRLPVEAEVTLPKQSAVAVRPIQRGGIITAADVEMRYVEEVVGASSRRVPIDDLEQLIGKEAAQAIKADSVIFSDQVQPPLLVHRGEVITVVARGGGIRVRTQARARENAALGDLVQVESLESRERYDAQVTGPKEATVLAGAPTQTNPSTARLPRPLREGRSEAGAQPTIPDVNPLRHREEALSAQQQAAWR
jgi:flagella basal body P-ring formation protein FlgA